MTKRGMFLMVGMFTVVICAATNPAFTNENEAKPNEAFAPASMTLAALSSEDNSYGKRSSFVEYAQRRARYCVIGDPEEPFMVCPLVMYLLEGDVCYCATYQGPLWGRAYRSLWEREN